MLLWIAAPAAPAQTASARTATQSREQAHKDSSDDVLDNDAVIKMVRTKLPAGVIVTAIRNSPGRYTVTPAALIRLSQAGVPEAVMEAVQAKAAESPSSGSPTPGPSHGQ